MTHFKSRRNVLYTETGDDTGVLLDLDSKFYFTLNATAATVWNWLEAAGTAGGTAADIANLLVEKFEVAHGMALEDVTTLLTELVDVGLVVEDGEPGRSR